VFFVLIFSIVMQLVVVSALLGLASAQSGGFCVKASPKNACTSCALGGSDCGGPEYCQSKKDPNCGPAPGPAPPAPTPAPGPAKQQGQCTQDAKMNACDSCILGHEDDCGGTNGQTKYCVASKAPQCPPLPTPPSTDGFCMKDAPKNSCSACGNQGECGGDGKGGKWYCQKAKDAQCGGPGPAPAPGQGGFCNKEAPKNSCQGCATESECGGDTTTSYCWKAKDAKCSGPAPGQGSCSASAPKNACQNCATEAECGGDGQGSPYCWAARDARCNFEQKIPEFLLHV